MAKKRKLAQRYAEVAVVQQAAARAQAGPRGTPLEAAPALLGDVARKQRLKQRAALATQIACYYRETGKQHALQAERTAWLLLNMVAGRPACRGAPLRPIARGEDPDMVPSQPCPAFNDQALKVAQQAIVSAAAGMGVSSEDALVDPYMLLDKCD